MLGKSVTGAVACEWLQRWLSATRAGDGVAAQEAVDAMGTAPHWPVLLQMVREKGYRGNALPPQGQGWPSEILTATREIAHGHLRRRPAVTTI
jgi:lysozyme family protein